MSRIWTDCGCEGVRFNNNILVEYEYVMTAIAMLFNN